MRVLLSSVALAVSTIVFEASPAMANCNNFCEGGSFDNNPTINFSSGNDSVGCGSLMQLINTGLYPDDFCANERAAIELACCFNMGPTKDPTPGPTLAPTPPTPEPTPLPTTPPTFAPTPVPTIPPTSVPTGIPTFAPTPVPTIPPTPGPTFPPTPFPSRGPRGRRTLSPTYTPSVVPTDFPTGTPTSAPTGTPTSTPTGAPTVSPTRSPAADPTVSPTDSPVQITAKDIVAENEPKISGSNNNLGASLRTTLLLGGMLWSAFVHWA